MKILPAGNPSRNLLLIGGGVAIIAGLYVYVQRKKTPASVGVPTPVGTVDAGLDLSSLTDNLKTILTSISDQNKTIQTNLASLITGSDTHIVGALNSQTKGFQDGMTALQNAELQQTKTLGDALGAGFAALNKQSGDIGGNLAKQIQGALDFTSQLNTSLEKQLEAFFKNAFDNLTSSVTEVRTLSQGMAKDIAANTGTLNGLTQSLASDSYVGFGLQSAAACYNPEKGDFDEACWSTKVVDWQSNNFNTAKQQARTKYAPCFKGDHYDLACVGKLVASRFGGG